MIKQVQLRGISRQPSDRMSADGGCDESLNVYLDSKETAPTLLPKDVTSDYYDGDLPARPYYLHRDNLILITPYNGGYPTQVSVKVIRNKAVLQTIALDGDSSHTIVSVSSTGNTLLISTEENVWYLLFKDNRYTLLGNRIPIPLIQFSDEVTSGPRRYVVDKSIDVSGTAWDEDLYKLSWVDDRTWLAKNERIDAEVSQILSDVKQNSHYGGKICLPVMMRYAVRLYDGEVYAASLPVLLGCWKRTADIVSFDLRSGIDGNNQSYVDVRGDTWVQNAGQSPDERAFYYVLMNIKEQIGDEWSDIISSIDIYCSDLICPYREHSKMRMVDLDPGVSSLYHKQLVIDTESTDDNSPEIIESVDNFYLVKRYTFEEFNAASAVDIDLSPYMAFGDRLYTRDLLGTTGYYNHHKMISSKSIVYNDRNYFFNFSRMLTRGYQEFPGVSTEHDGYSLSSPNDYAFEYAITSERGNMYAVMSEFEDGTQWFKMQESEVQADWRFPYAYWAYPDPRCTSLYIIRKPYQSEQTSVVKVPMRTHSKLDISFCFWGFGVTLDDYFDSHTPVSSVPQEKRIEPVANKIYGTLVDNPFIFLPSTVVTIGDGTILSLAVATKALSEGQFGGFPLYAFTTEGIWALPITSDGRIGLVAPMQREIAIEGTVSPIDDAVVFSTQKGVMLLSGSKVQNLSSFMNGQHYNLPAEIRSVLPQGIQSMQAISDTDTFMAFIKGSRCVYDYAGERLVFFNPQKQYQYTYELVSQTWHKLSRPLESGASFTWIGGLNSYPESLVALRSVSAGAASYKLIDVATPRDISDDSLETMPQVIISRPLDFGEPDIRKTIKNLRVRGVFARGNVKYMLLGSMDCQHWQRLTSLRGGSYRWFRIVLLSELEPMERISWIDLDVEGRLTNKMR